MNKVRKVDKESSMTPSMIYDHHHCGTVHCKGHLNERTRLIERLEDMQEGEGIISVLNGHPFLAVVETDGSNVEHFHDGDGSFYDKFSSPGLQSGTTPITASEHVIASQDRGIGADAHVVAPSMHRFTADVSSYGIGDSKTTVLEEVRHKGIKCLDQEDGIQTAWRVWKVQLSYLLKNGFSVERITEVLKTIIAQYSPPVTWFNNAASSERNRSAVKEGEHAKFSSDELCQTDKDNGNDVNEGMHT